MPYREIEPMNAEEAIRNQTIKMSVQETYKILSEMSCLLDEFSQIINGSTPENRDKKNAGCLWEEARMLTALAYENLQKLQEIKGSII